MPACKYYEMFYMHLLFFKLWLSKCLLKSRLLVFRGIEFIFAELF